MDIELYDGATKAVITTQGGYVTNLSNDKGDILYPKRSLVASDGSAKVRGGCHVCLPCFGPGGASGLAQHGFGRTSMWRVGQQTTTAVTLVCERQTGSYASMDAHLTYALTESGFTMQLIIRNSGTDSIVVSPGFHPYFYLRSEAPVMNGVTYNDLTEVAGTLFFDGDTQKLEIAGRSLVLRSKNLPRWAVWTDCLGDYFCVEPTQAGYAFADTTMSADTVAPGNEQMYECSIDW